MKMPPLRRSIIVAMLAVWAAACTAPAGGASADPTQPAASAAPSASPVASGGGKYGDEPLSTDDAYGDEYATPAP